MAGGTTVQVVDLYSYYKSDKPSQCDIKSFQILNSQPDSFSIEEEPQGSYTNGKLLIKTDRFLNEKIEI